MERLSELSNVASDTIAEIYDEIYEAVIALLGFSKNNITGIIERIIRAAVKKTCQNNFDYLITAAISGVPSIRKRFKS